jgi:hypothetical protein
MQLKKISLTPDSVCMPSVLSEIIISIVRRGGGTVLCGRGVILLSEEDQIKALEQSIITNVCAVL